MRVHELAKELNLSSKDLLSKLKELNIKIGSHMSLLDSKTVDKIKQVFKTKKKIPTKKIPTKPIKKIRKPKPPKPKVVKEEKIIEEKEFPPEEKKEIIEQLPLEKPAIEEVSKEIEVEFPIAVKELAAKLKIQPSSIIKKLMTDFGVLANINQSLNEDLATKIASNLGCILKKVLSPEELILKVVDRPEDLQPRWPIVTLMGHVDHGKTSLLDAIRKTKIADYEHGGITQHIGAYEVNVASSTKQGQIKKITFLDTPGHEAFTAMRARGATTTDLVILVVAADDGVMPQTIEALDHAKEAKVPVVVAINKIDKPQVNIDRVKKQLDGLELKPEDWGGKTVMVGVSAKTHQGLDELLEMILLEAEMLELKANPRRAGQGVVVEAKISKQRGTVTTLLVKTGTLHQGDIVVAGSFYGRIKALFDDHARPIEEAGPSKPAEVIGLSGLPQAGEQFFVVADEQQARQIVSARQEEERTKKLFPPKRISLDELSTQIKEGKVKELKLIIKADVQGSLEALVDSLNKLPTKEVSLRTIHTGVGSINISDVMLASASNAIIVGFHVGADFQSQELAKQEGVEIRTYRLIYETIEEIKAALEGLLEPTIKKIFLGKVQVKKIFKVTKGGTIAGSYVQKGKILRNSFVGLLRNGQVVYEGNVVSLKHLKDDVREATEGMECGVSLGIDDIQVGDVIEAYGIEKIARKL